MLPRHPYAAIWRELSAEKSMVFLAGPRQCGKTTLAKQLATSFRNSLYFNWDVATDKRRLVADPYFFQGIVRVDDSRPLVMFDEIHKYRDWRNYLKGAYDRFHEEFLFLVSGSGRLDLQRKRGDSLAGRYFLMHLWPLTLAELHGGSVTLAEFRGSVAKPHAEPAAAAQATWDRLARSSGFPEPYVADKPSFYRRWSAAYHRQVIREDVRDLTDVRNVDDIEILFSLLPSKVGAPLSLPGLAADLKVAYNTVKNWLAVLERFYLTFTLSPWTPRISRTLHKDRKLYLFDYAGIEDASARFENMVAFELFRAVSNWNDMGWGNFGLHFIRTKEGREVDFLVSENRKPLFLVEAKRGDMTPAPNLLRFQKALGIPGIQLLNQGQGFVQAGSRSQPVLIAPAALWLPRLP
jgi:predicted AAA+ superfamily ATPase